MSNISQQAELWSATPVEVPPLRLDDTHLTYLADGTQVALEGLQIGLHKREPAVAVFLFVVAAVGGVVCGGLGSYGGGIAAAVCGGVPALFCGLIGLFALVRSPKLRVAPAGAEDLDWSVPGDADFEGLEFLIARIERQSKQAPVRDLQHATLAFAERLPSSLPPELRDVSNVDLSQPLPRVGDDAVNAKLDVAKLAFEVTFDPEDMMQVMKWGSRYQVIVIVGDLEKGEVFDPGVDKLDAFFGQLETPRPADSIARRNQTRLWLVGEGLGLPPVHLPSIGVDELSVRSPEEVARRAHTLFLVSMASQEFLATGAIIALRGPLDGVADALSPAEAAFVEAPSQELAQQLAFRIEAVALLAWAMSWIADPPSVDEPFSPEGDEDVAMMGRAKDGDACETLRTVAQIADQLDRVYCAHWLVVDGRMKGRPPQDLNPGAVMEQHYALLWLTEPTAWDDIQPHT